LRFGPLEAFILATLIRILMLNWAKVADGAVAGGGANGYCQGLASELASRGHEVSYLSSGLTYTASADGKGKGLCEIRRLDDWRGIRVFEVLNSPVLAPGVYQFRNPLGEVSDPVLETEVARVVRLISPDVVHFHNIEGFTSGCVGAIRSALPEARIVFSLHNYHTVCPQVNLMQQGRRLCTNFENGWACPSCAPDAEPHAELLQRSLPDGGAGRIVPLPQRAKAWVDSFRPAQRILKPVPGTPVTKATDCAGARRAMEPLIVPSVECHGGANGMFESGVALNTVTTEPPCDLPLNNFGLRRAAMVQMLSSCDRVLAVSDFVRQKFEALGVAAGPMRMMQIGSRLADAVNREPALRTTPRFGEEGRPLRLVFMGYHNFVKGLHVLVEALELLDGCVSARIEFHVYAKDVEPMEPRLRRLGLRLAGLKLLHGYRPDEIPALLAGKDVGVVPSVWWDNGPQTVMEFMACGLPVIGAEMGGIPEWVRNGENGWTFRGNDPSALARVIESIVQSPAEFRRIAAAVTAQKGMLEHAAEIEWAYSELLGREAMVRRAESLTLATSKPHQRHVIAVIPTWNRPDDAMAAVRSVRAQTGANADFEIVVVDNGSDVGVVQRLEEALKPNVVVLNAAGVGERPRLSAALDTRSVHEGDRNPGQAGRVVLIKNALNLGGTGGFLAGLSWAQDQIQAAKALVPRDDAVTERFVWLIDDDAVPASDACSRMLEAMNLAPDVGLVGARSVDPDHPGTTLETTVYFDPKTGHLTDAPARGHRMDEAHRAWLSKVGTTRGRGPYSGVIETDVSAACCLLAKAEVLDKVGLWDRRYFIYEDDVDWCLRAGQAGYRVLLHLDATVKHKTWHAKLSFQRLAFWLYQSSRNRMWTIAKVAADADRARVLDEWRRRLLWDALVAGLCRRVTHARVLERAVRDELANMGGRCPVEIPEHEPTAEAVRRLGGFDPRRSIVIICDRPEFLIAARGLRSRLRAAASPVALRFIECVRNDLPTSPPEADVERIVYSPRFRSKFRRQAGLVFRRIAAVVVFDTAGDLPLLPGQYNVHVDCASLDIAAVEHDGYWARLGFIVRWLRTRWRVTQAVPQRSEGQP